MQVIGNRYAVPDIDTWSLALVTERRRRLPVCVGTKGGKVDKKIYKVALLVVLACITKVIQVHKLHASLRTPAHNGTGLFASTDADFSSVSGMQIWQIE